MSRAIDLSTYLGDGAPRCANCRVRCTSFDGSSPADGLYQRHKQECVYALGKKQQSAKESLESAQAKKSPEIRSQLDQVGDTVDNVLVESSNRTVLLPALTRASTESRQSLSCERNKTIQGISSFTNVVDTGRALPEDSIWNLDLDQSSNHISTPSLLTELSNVSVPNAISMAPFASDTEWQFSVDDQFFAEPISASTETCSTAFNELDMSQLYNPETEGFDATRDSGELFEFLSLREKVRTQLPSAAIKAFPDGFCKN